MQFDHTISHTKLQEQLAISNHAKMEQAASVTVHLGSTASVLLGSKEQPANQVIII